MGRGWGGKEEKKGDQGKRGGGAAGGFSQPPQHIVAVWRQTWLVGGFPARRARRGQPGPWPGVSGRWDPLATPVSRCCAHPPSLLLSCRGHRDVFLGGGGRCSCWGASCAAGGWGCHGERLGAGRGRCCDSRAPCFTPLLPDSPGRPCANGADPRPATSHRAAAVAKHGAARAEAIAGLCCVSPLALSPQVTLLGRGYPTFSQRSILRSAHSTEDPELTSGSFVTQTGSTHLPPARHLFQSLQRALKEILP